LVDGLSETLYSEPFNMVIGALYKEKVLFAGVKN